MRAGSVVVPWGGETCGLGLVVALARLPVVVSYDSVGASHSPVLMDRLAARCFFELARRKAADWLTEIAALTRFQRLVLWLDVLM